MKKVLFVLIAVITVSACSINEMPVQVFNDKGQMMPQSNQDGDGMLFSIADGSWSKFKYADGISAYYNKNIWIDIQVPNWSDDKEVGIVWTDNNWSTVNTAYAVKEADLGDNAERWGIDITPVGEIKVHRSMGPVYWTGLDNNAVHLGYPHRAVVIQYAIFFNYNGQTLWNNNNYQNYQLVVVE